MTSLNARATIDVIQEIHTVHAHKIVVHTKVKIIPLFTRPQAILCE